MNPIVAYVRGIRILSTGSGANARAHHMVLARRRAAQREGATAIVCSAWQRSGGRVQMFGGKLRISYPATRVTMIRIAPGNAQIHDSDNLAAALKATRDGIADALGVDDRDQGRRSQVEWITAQQTGPWGLRILIES